MPAKPSARIKAIEDQLRALPHTKDGTLKIVLDRRDASLSVEAQTRQLTIKDLNVNNVFVTFDDTTNALSFVTGDITVGFHVDHGISVVIQDEEMSSVKRSAALGVRGRRNGAAIVARTAYSTLIHRHLGLTGRPT